MENKFSVIWLASRVPTEAAAYEYLEELMWNGHPVCPHCGVIDGHYYLKPKNGVSRETSRGKQSERRTWKCCACRQQFSVTTKTVMHGSHISVRTWLFVIFEVAGNKNGIAAREIERKYAVNARTAWHMTCRIREAMAGGFGSMFSGTVISDETWIGGNVKNRHANKTSERKQGKTDKTPVMTLVSKETGEIRSQIVDSTTTEALRSVLAENVDIPNSTLHTDAYMPYRKIGESFMAHEWVDHADGEYVRNGASTNAAEGFFSQLKRSIHGTHHYVSIKHLPRYLAEFDFRYSTCDISTKTGWPQSCGEVLVGRFHTLSFVAHVK